MNPPTDWHTNPRQPTATGLHPDPRDALRDEQGDHGPPLLRLPQRPRRCVPACLHHSCLPAPATYHIHLFTPITFNPIQSIPAEEVEKWKKISIGATGVVILFSLKEMVGLASHGHHEDDKPKPDYMKVCHVYICAYVCSCSASDSSPVLLLCWWYSGLKSDVRGSYRRV